MTSATERVRVGLLNVSHMPDAAEANFRRIFDSIDDAELAAYDARNLEFPDPENTDAVIVTGSIDSVNDDREYIHATREWLQTADVPIFGVCFGHQLIAAAFGGTVARMPELELGYRRFTLGHHDNPLFDGIPEEPIGFLCHEDTVVTPPPNATILASNEYGVQALQLGETVSVQFHPEATAEHARNLLTELDLPPQSRRRALETVTEANAESALQLHRLFANFVAEIRDAKR